MSIVVCLLPLSWLHEKEGDSDAAGIRAYQATMLWRGLTRPNAELRKTEASAEEAMYMYWYKTRQY